MRAGFVAGLGLSLVAHAAAIAGVAVLIAPLDRAKSRIEPIELMPAPPPPPPPELPPPAPPAPVAPAKPKQAKPKVKKPPAPVVLAPDAGPDATTDDVDAGVAADGGPVEDAGADAHVSDAHDSDAGDGGGPPVVASGEHDAGAPPGPVDPGVIDLRPFAPPGEKVILVLRTDRLRDTPWAPRLEAILAPMPDHRMVIEGTGLGLVETFDTVVISTADPRDVTSTFLGARSTQDEAALRRALSRPLPGGSSPRLRWNGNSAERLDPRVARLGDPRRILLPQPGWFVLVRPEHLSAGSWLEALAGVEGVTGDGQTIAVVMLTDLGTAALSLPIPGLPPLPAPQRLTTAVTLEGGGIILTGAATFADEAAATAFVEAVERVRGQALGSFTGKVVLRSFFAEGAARRLSLARTGAAITFSTSLSTAEALGLLEQAAEMSRRFFLRVGAGETPK